MQNQPQLVLYLRGPEGLAQLDIVLPTFDKFRGESRIVLYTDQDISCCSISRFIDEFRVLSPTANPHGFIEFGGVEFARMSQEKIWVIKDACERARYWIIYFDTDIVVLRPFFSEVQGFMRQGHVLVSGRGSSLFPRAYCTGIVAVNCTPEAKRIATEWLDHHVRRLLTIAPFMMKRPSTTSWQSAPILNHRWT